MTLNKSTNIFLKAKIRSRLKEVKDKKTLGGLLGTRFNLESLNKKLKETQAEGQWWKRS